MNEIKELNYKTLADVMTRCHTNRRYQACVVFKYRQSLNDFIKEFEGIDLGKNVYIDENYDLLEMAYSLSIQFNGESSLSFWVARDSNISGRKFNEILYETGLSDYYIYSELYPALVEYKAIDGSPLIEEFEVEPFDKEILDYLDGFNIIKEDS